MTSNNYITNYITNNISTNYNQCNINIKSDNYISINSNGYVL